ncbi:hypothetical protein [Aquimarina sp. RZ0]|uniref:hypothetical protein n=1 Tax=Aquimarina sp. RZ0 TaxID=2607730 RepID=UPI0011F0C9E2|nr:hypothetical protein [Aquimarina sp. RZ0]KAA1244537.1 hypothetical protein F0000_16255 [Aquimarina sp. RZ0]
MKINLNKLYIVYKPTKYSERVDVFSGRSNNISGLRNQFRGGLEPKEIHGIYTTLSEANRVTDTLLKGKVRKKSTKRKKKSTSGYALFSDAVMAKDKYRVTTPPKVIYPTRKAAQKEVDKIRKKTGRNPEIKIMTYDKSKR